MPVEAQEKSLLEIMTILKPLISAALVDMQSNISGT